ncbi:MAG: oligosaccharide flippase family protein [Deltaproteobacteria bacterium]|nr:oligosaccharide flippase family protein [Deltaproteobacteria bacterium]
MPIVKHIPLRRGSDTEDVLWRVAKNAAWLALADGLRLVRVVTNILLARFLGPADYGTMTLARETVRYAALPGDMGIATYGQAEAARCADYELTGLAEEVLPARAVIGVILFALFSGACILTLHDTTTRLVFLLTGIVVISETLRADWLFRGRERFDLLIVARAVESIGFLLVALLVGSRRHAVIFDTAGWSAAEVAMSAVWLLMLRDLLGRAIRLRVNFRAWLRHAREAIYLPIALALVWAGWLLLLWIVTCSGSRRDAGTLAAPYNLTQSLVNLGAVLVMAFFPTSATLDRESQVFAQSRRAFTELMLIFSLPIGALGGTVSTRLISLTLGSGYQESAQLFEVLIWLAPLRLLRMTYSYTLISSGFLKPFLVGPAVSFLTMAALGLPLCLLYRLPGAALAALGAELFATAATIMTSYSCHRDAAMPRAGVLVKIVALNLGLTLLGAPVADRFGPAVYLISAGVVYVAGIIALGLVDIAKIAAIFARRTGRTTGVTSASS